MSQSASTSSFTPPSTQPATPPSAANKDQQIVDLLKKKASEAPTPPSARSSSPPRDSEADYQERRPGDDNTPGAPRPALEDDDDDDDLSEGLTKKQQKSLREFAAEKGMSVRALMGLVATDPGESDEPLTLGQLKDSWKENRNWQQQRDDFEDFRETAHSEITVARQQVQDIFSRIAQVVPPQTLARVFADVDADSTERLRKARAQVLEYFPEWHDAQAMARDREKITGVLGSYGFSKHDVGGITDPRIVKFLMDAIRQNERYARLKTGYKRENVPTREAPSRKGHQPSTDERAKALAAKGDKDGAIALIVEKALSDGNRKSR